MSEEKWYHGRLNRQKAEELVNKAGIDGSFVVRASESIPGAYALSVLCSGSIHTYRILPTENGLLAVQTINGVQQRKFTSITELIVAYRSPQNGLICGLTNPVGPSPDKPTLTPPPAVATPIPVHDPVRMPSTTQLPGPPLPVGLKHGGVRVMLSDLKLPQKPKQDVKRELPPLPPPSRDPPPRPATVKVASSSNPKTIEIQGKVQEKARRIVSSCTNFDQQFLDSVQQYCTEAVHLDIDGVLKGDRQCVELQKLLAKEAGQFQSELELFLQKIEILLQLFDVQSHFRAPNNMRAERDVDLESFLTRLADCKTAVKNLDKRTSINIKTMAGMKVESMYGTTQGAMLKSSNKVPEYTFEVKLDGGLKLQRQKLRVNVDQGKLQILKVDGREVVMDCSYNKVLQIIKNNKSPSKLSVVFEGGKKRDYAFEGSEKREAFCQVMQLLRNMNSDNAEPDCVSIFIGAWNMGDAIPSVNIHSWFKCGGSGRTLDPTVCEIPHDIYAIGTQETGMPEKEWLNKVTETIKEVTRENYHLVAMDALWHIKIIILVKEKHKNRVSHVQTSSVKTGIANTLGNKGAVAVAFQFGGTSLCFINAHLTSGNEKCARRNQNYHDIMRALNLGHDRCSMFDLTNRFDHLFFLGDLNYRLEMDVQDILSHIKKKELSSLYNFDQLRREKEMNKVFYGFSEDEITFQPTYRYERGTREAYSHLKVKRTGIRINVPSWCDRVLWKSYPETHNTCKAYGCCDDIMTSDHSPVFCNIQVGVRGQYVSNEDLKSGSTSNKQPAMIIFESVDAILKAPSKTNFYLQFHSACLASSVKSRRCAKVDLEMGANCVRVSWDRDMLPEITPIISDREYLVDQHLLVLVKGEDDNESHAEFVLALRSMIGTSPQKFQEHLTRKGEDAGQIQGCMHVKTRDTTQARKEKTYDFIQTGVGMREEVPEAAIYSDTTEWSTQPVTPKPSITALKPSVSNKLGTVGSGVVLGPKIPGFPSALPRLSTASVDSRPPIPTPAQPVLPPVHSDPEPTQRMSIQAVEPHTLSVTKEKQTSPVFPARFPHTEKWPTSNDTPSFGMNQNSFSSSQPPSSSAASLDAVIAEFEAAGSMFEDLSKAEEEQKKKSLPRSHGSPVLQNYETKSGKVPSMTHTASFDNRRPLPSPGLPSTRIPATAPPPLNYPISSGLPPHRTGIGPVPVPSFPPPPGPAPQRPQIKRKSVRVPGSSVPVMTVPEMMARLGLSQYTAALTENGWDTLEFLGDVTDDDLADCGIIMEDHRRAIMDCVRNMEYLEQ